MLRSTAVNKARRVVGAVEREIGAFTPRRSAGVLLTRLLPAFRMWRLRTAILRLGGLHGVHPTVFFAATPTMNGGGTLTIGKDSFVNVQALFDISADIRLGKKVALAQRVTIVTETHQMGPHRGRAAARYAKPVIIGDGCWIGAGAVILPGVEIGAGSIVAAGAVVTADVEPDTLVGGIPAKAIRSLD